MLIARCVVRRATAVCVMALPMHLAQPAPSHGQLPAVRAAHRAIDYGHLPIAFEPNLGQAAPQIRFLAHGPGYSIYFTDDGITVAHGAGWSGTREGATGGQSANLAPALVENRSLLQAPSMIRPGRIVAEDRLPGVVSYFRGADPRRWHTGIPTYARLIYRNLVPGVDGVLSGRGGQLRLDLLAHGGRPATVRPGTGWQPAGVHAAPLADGLQASPADSSATAAPLTYVTYLGGSGPDVGAGVAVDAQGDAYVTGSTNSADFAVTPGAFGSYYHGHADVFVARLDPTGTYLLDATYIGGNQDDNGNAIAIDAQGDAVVVGDTNSFDFPHTAGALQPTKRSGGLLYDAFVLKLNPAGTRLLYSTYLGARQGSTANAIALDTAGDAYVTGATFKYTDAYQQGFLTTIGAAQTSYAGGANDAFVARLNPGGRLLYATYLGGSGEDRGIGIAVDQGGDAVVVGQTSSKDFPGTGRVSRKLNDGGFAEPLAFVAILDPAGARIRAATYLGGSNANEATGAALGAQGTIYVTGDTASRDFPVTAGALQTSYGGGEHDAFVAELDPGDLHVIAGTYLGGAGDDVSQAIAVDTQGDAYVTGTTTSTTFPVTAGALVSHVRPESYSVGVAFLTELNPPASALRYSTYLSDLSFSTGVGIAIGPDGSAYLAGRTWAAMPITSGAIRAKIGGFYDGFAARVVIPMQRPDALDPVSPPAPGADIRYFPTTRHSLAGPFSTFWSQHGALAILGLPLSQPFDEGGQTVQYFERARLVLTAGRVTLTPLGRWLTAGRRFATVPASANTATSLYFPSTGHTLTGRFLSFWQANQGSARFGPPISEPRQEVNGDGSGRTYLVQYFADARLEYHPEVHDPAFQVQLGRLGYEWLHRHGLL